MRVTNALTVGLVLLASLATASFSQQESGALTAPPPVYVPAGPNVSQQVAGLAEQPARHFGIVFDHNELELAQGILEAQGMDAHHAALALKGISIDNYRYKQPAFYTPEAMDALIGSYKAAGWKHLVNANQTAANTAQPHGTATDMWVHFSGTRIDGLTVLERSSKMMNVVQVSCDLRPMDLLHLGGHFGIPKVDPGAVMVPAPR